MGTFVISHHWIAPLQRGNHSWHQRQTFAHPDCPSRGEPQSKDSESGTRLHFRLSAVGDHFSQAAFHVVRLATSHRAYYASLRLQWGWWVLLCVHCFLCVLSARAMCPTPHSSFGCLRPAVKPRRDLDSKQQALSVWHENAR